MGENIGYVQFEPQAGLLQVALLKSTGEDEGVRSFLSIDNIEGIIFFPTKELWLNAVNSQCDCEDECDQDCDENDECFCPECLTERVANVKRMEAAESMEAIERTVHDTIADSAPSAETIAACQIELEAGRKAGYKA